MHPETMHVHVTDGHVFVERRGVAWVPGRVRGPGGISPGGAHFLQICRRTCRIEVFSETPLGLKRNTKYPPRTCLALFGILTLGEKSRLHYLLYCSKAVDVLELWDRGSCRGLVQRVAELLTGLQRLLQTSGFYFSNEIDLTQSLQRKARLYQGICCSRRGEISAAGGSRRARGSGPPYPTGSSPPQATCPEQPVWENARHFIFDTADSRFVWNKEMAKIFLHQDPRTKQWLSVLLQGFVGEKTVR
eukprot:g18595.t1